jgi:small subunit ribosomal protein S20
MANNKSTEKRIRQSAREREQNRGARSAMRTAVKQLRQAVANGDSETARNLLPETLRLIDVTAKKKAVHANTAARTKSRLVRAVRASAAS